MSGQRVSLGINLTGFVQGRGVRPAVAGLARALKLSGAVWNTPHGVSIHVMGEDVAVDEFLHRLDARLQEFGGCQRNAAVDWPVVPSDHFRILSALDVPVLPASEQRPATSLLPFSPNFVSALVPPDTAICAACLKELGNPMDRRYRWAMNGCLECGPRYSILRAMPWERGSTVMADWSLCRLCSSEYDGTGNARSHSQAISCPECGPQVRSQVPGDRWKAMANLLRAGQLLLLKGIGGYQILCDAANELAVQKIRSLKRRPSKPLAVMVPSEDWLEGSVSEHEREALRARDNPIVILPGTAGLLIADSVTAGLGTAGVLLPSSGLHFLLLHEFQGPLVVTSANDESEPMIYRDGDVQHLLQLTGMHLLSHDRQIVRPVDDSVVRVIGERSVTIRAGRGLSPMSLPLNSDQQILAVGGQQKVSVSLCNGSQAVMGPHLGNMETLAARQRFIEHVHDAMNLYQLQPAVIVHDEHPDYFTTQWAGQQFCQTMAVQHHHAHVVTGMLEHNLTDEVLGIAFDGSGFGGDGSIRGGEFLLADRLSARRFGSLRPFGLVGGEAAILQPWRVAVALLAETFPDKGTKELHDIVCGHHQSTRANQHHCTEMDIQHVQALLRSGISVQTTSMGRLFDGVACLILGTTMSEFEGSPAMLLEDLAWTSTMTRRSMERGEVTSGRTLRGAFVIENTKAGAPAFRQADWRSLIRHLIAARNCGIGAADLALLFHWAVADLISDFSDEFPDKVVVLSGGCFQNRLLCEMVLKKFEHRSGTLMLPGRLPPNDGGLSAGQLAIAAARLNLRTASGGAIAAGADSSC